MLFPFLEFKPRESCIILAWPVIQGIGAVESALAIDKIVVRELKPFALVGANDWDLNQLLTTMSSHIVKLTIFYDVEILSMVVCLSVSLLSIWLGWRQPTVAKKDRSEINVVIVVGRPMDDHGP